MLDPNYPSYPRFCSCAFVAGDTTQAKVLVGWPDAGVGSASFGTPAVLLSTIAGETALPNEPTVRQRLLQGGCRVIDGSIASTDGTARSVLLWLGRLLSITDNFGGTHSVTGTNAITRATGSFITDGWRVGDQVMLFNATTAANNGVAGLLTTVTATVLTANGTPWTNETMPASGCQLVRVSQRTRIAIPANSGNADTIQPVPLLQVGKQDLALAPLPDAGYSLGADDVLIASMVATVSALPASVQVQATINRY